jgi:hypothetical protein
VVFIINHSVVTYSLFERVEMTKIELDLPELPDGYEYTGEYRRAKKGDLVLYQSQNVNEWKDITYSICKLPIIRKKPPAYTPPKGVFNPGWLAVDGDGAVAWYSRKPIFWPEDDEWCCPPAGTSIYFRSYLTNECCINDDLLPPANIRGVKAIWEIKE